MTLGMNDFGNIAYSMLLFGRLWLFSCWSGCSKRFWFQNEFSAGIVTVPSLTFTHIVAFS